MDATGLIGGAVVLVVAVALAAKYFPKGIAEFVRRAGVPYASSIKKQSEEMLADMDRNVAERKGRRGR